MNRIALEMILLAHSHIPIGLTPGHLSNAIRRQARKAGRPLGSTKDTESSDEKGKGVAQLPGDRMEGGTETSPAMCIKARGSRGTPGVEGCSADGLGVNVVINDRVYLRGVQGVMSQGISGGGLRWRVL